MIEPLLKKEFARLPRARSKFNALLKEIRARGLSRVEGDLQPGVASMCAPVFGIGGTIVAALSVVGIQGAIDVSWNGVIAKTLRQAAEDLSQRLGFTGGVTT